MSRIQIIGAGAVGMLVASYLENEHFTVHLVCRRQQQVDKLNNRLIRQNIDETETQCSVTASTEIQSNVDLNIVCVKSGQVEGIINLIPKHIPTLFLQNGLAHYKIAKNSGIEKLAFGSAQFGALKVKENVVSHRGVGVLKVSYENNKDKFMDSLLTIQNEHFPIMLEQNSLLMLMEKSVYNSLINPLTAILRLKNGQLLTNPFAYSLLKRLYNELSHTFPMASPSFDEVIALCKRTADNTSSMLGDHLAGRISEANAIMGALIEMTEEPMPTVQAVYELVLAIENSEEFNR